jgi:hypothetical protein
VLITRFWDGKREANQRKWEIFRTLMRNRRERLNPEFGIQENMNIGIPGRGTQYMDDDLYYRLAEIIDYFPTINQHGYKSYLLGKAL